LRASQIEKSVKAGRKNLSGLHRKGNSEEWAAAAAFAQSGTGTVGEVIADYTEALRLNPNDAEAYLNRGNAYADHGEIDKAIADYTEALRLNPNYADAYYNRGNAYAGHGEIDKAIADYTEALRIDPGYADAYYNRGNAYYYQSVASLRFNGVC
jgi:tetratricopeptide (TPR) repeat protein